jgi:hypothetical protein
MNDHNLKIIDVKKLDLVDKLKKNVQCYMQ